MQKYITRTLGESKVKVLKVGIENSQPVVYDEYEFVVQGKIDEDKALKLAKKQWPDYNLLVKSIDYTEHIYRMALEKFAELAEVVELSLENIYE